MADSYNHKIKVCDMQSSAIKTVCGSGHAGYSDGTLEKSKLSEPSGLAVGPGDTLFIADTNNNLVRIMDCASGTLSTLELKGVPQPRVSPLEAMDDLLAAAPAKVTGIKSFQSLIICL